MSFITLEEKSKSFEVAPEILNEREAARLSFVEKFPLEKLKELTIDQFVQGTTDNSFCYWLEFKKIGFGIGGGNASKFGIYKTKNSNTLVYARGSGKNKLFLDDNAANKIYLGIRSKLIKALEFTANDEIDKIRSLEIPMWNMVLQKILSMYYPNKFLAIGSSTVLINCAKEFGINNIDLSAENLIHINYECKKAIINNSHFANWSYEKIGLFIWDVFDGEDKKRKSKESIQYWLYAPGENAHMWEEFYSEGIMGLGWDKIGDLNQYNSRDDMKKALTSAYGGVGTKMNDILTNENFFKNVKIGDIIIAKKGRKELLGFGVVDSDYFYDKLLSSYQKRRKVSWKLKGSWKVDFNLALKTLTDITKYPTEDKNYNTYYERLLGIMQANVIMPLKLHNKYPLNSIFFGPPGTGKTYNTINHAISIIDSINLSEIDWHFENRSSLKQRFDSLLIDDWDNPRGQIGFATFHQSMSYEDFIEGIKPGVNDKGDVNYDVEPGIFKMMATIAKDNWMDAEKAIKEELSFEDAFSKLKDEWQFDSEMKFPLKKIGNDYSIIGFSKTSIHFRKASGGTGHTMSISTLRDFYYDKREIMHSGIGIYYPALLEKLKSYQQTTAHSKQLKNYVLIIDEINRGNVSQIFGELITLIEDDKRLGKSEALELILPYSKEKFGIPPNLFIIGTMNTADRSVEALDTALRRRFSFIEMPPNYSIPQIDTDIDGVNLKSLLLIMNARIEKLLNKDHQIGHAYFIGVNNIHDLKRVFKDKIIPLLQEYFYGDYGKIGLVLGKSFIHADSDSGNSFVGFAKYDYEDSSVVSDLNERKVYSITSDESWDFQSIIQ